MYECAGGYLSADPSIADWLAAISSAVSTIAVVGGLFYAHNQIGVWRTEARSRRRAEIAEDVLAASQGATDILNGLRSPLSSIPKEELSNKAYTYEERGRRLAERASEFEALRGAQVRAKAILQDSAVDAAITEIFSCRAEFWIALDLLAEYAGQDFKDLTPEEKEMVKEARANAFGRGRKEDPLGTRLDSAIAVLESHLGPIVRLDK
jgi:hypothetical protein